MDWGKAKNIFIVSFLVLNVILGYQLWLSRDHQVETVQLTENRREELEQMMRLKNIRFEGTLPKEAPDLNLIYVQYLKNKDGDVAKEFNPPLEVEDATKLESLSEALKEHAALEKYQYDPVLSDTERLVFHQTEEGMPIFPSFLHVELAGNHHVTSIQLREVKVKSQGSERQVISAFTALRTLAESYLPRDSRILDIRIGYYGQHYNSDVQVLAPVWRVALENGGFYYVNGITGAVDTANTAKTSPPNQDGQ